MNADDPSVILLAQGDLLGTNLYAYCDNNPVMNFDPNGYFYISLENIGKILLTIGINPIPFVLLGIGLWKLKTFLVAKYLSLLAKLGAFWGPVANAAIIIIGAAIGIPTILDVATALWDCILQRKKGIEFTVKKTWWGMPYAFDIYAK